MPKKKDKQTEFIYGIHSVGEAVKANRRNFYEICVIKGKPSSRMLAIVNRAEKMKIPVSEIDTARMESMTGTGLHQGIGARVSPYPIMDISDITRHQEMDPKDKLFLLLDNIQDPQNLGAMVRTALCAGIDGIIIPKDRSAPPSPSVSRISAGALEHIRLAYVTNLVSAITILKEHGVWIAGLDASADRPVYTHDLTGPLALVIGSEEKGMRPLVKKQCDFLISIPQQGPIDSLNASAAGAVVMYEAYRQRSAVKDAL